MSEETPNLPSPEKLKQNIEKWRETVASIFGTIVSFLAILNIDPIWAKIIAAICTIIGLVITILLYRRNVLNTKKRTRLEEIVNKENKRPQGAAIRGLRRFRSGEQLPGEVRRRSAATLFSQVKDFNFKIGIVTGDSGAGKSSLLECALIKPLEEENFLVEFVSNLDPQLPLDDTSDRAQTDQVLEVWEILRKRVITNRGDSGKNVVLILDQFEELLSHIRSTGARKTLGKKLREEIENGWRIVIGIRKEYFAELKDMATGLGYTLSLQDTFILKNFNSSEAKEIIHECAMRDKIELEEGLSGMITSDLTIAGEIRPPDLQIVCEALHGELTIDRYRRDGRATGLRSRFIKDIIDLTGDALLARTVLRELCDIPNNKKRPEPLSAIAIAEKARASTAGARATDEAVKSVLESLSRSYIVVRVNNENNDRWSLIHDYIVESIKIATEEQATRSEAAAAELEYFISEKEKGHIQTIPLARLAEIRKYGPPALLTQDAVRTLIRKSMIMGYGKPIIVVSIVALVSVSAVLLAATQWNVWQQHSPSLSHWEAFGKREARWLRAIQLADSPRLIAVGAFGSDVTERITIWDTQTGIRLVEYSGRLSIPYSRKNQIWSYNEKTGKLSRWQPPAKKELTIMTSHINRPRGELKVIKEVGELSNKKLFLVPNFPYRGKEDLWLAVLNLSNKSWTLRKESEYKPLPTTSRTVRTDGGSSSLLNVKLCESADNKTRLTVWSLDYSYKIIDKQFENRKVKYIGIIEEGEIHYLSILVEDKRIEIIPIRIQTIANERTVPNFDTLSHTVITLPKELNLPERDFNLAWEISKGYLFVDRQQISTIIWRFDPIAMEINDPIISSAPMPSTSDATLVWRPESGKGVMVWYAGDSAPIKLPQIEVQSTDKITFTSDQSRLLLKHDDNSIELWGIDKSKRAASLLRKIEIENYNSFNFSNDEKIIIVRQEGGVLYGWTRDGNSLGVLGTVGSDVIWATYNPDCKRILIWTQEGQRLDWRLGNKFPIFGFYPVQNCDMNQSTRLKN